MVPDFATFPDFYPYDREFAVLKHCCLTLQVAPEELLGEKVSVINYAKLGKSEVIWINSDAPVGQILREFFSGFYGNGGTFTRRLFPFVERVSNAFLKVHDVDAYYELFPYIAQYAPKSEVAYHAKGLPIAHLLA
jgi:hypothetical protein